MQNGMLLGGVVKTAGFLLFFTGLFFVAQAYTMAFHGVYLDCFAEKTPACVLRPYNEPTLTSVLWGTVLALGATMTFYLGNRALRWTRKPQP